MFDNKWKLWYNIIARKDLNGRRNFLYCPRKGEMLMYITLSDMVQLGILICAIVALIKQEKKHK